jgi:hypothetical protein
MSKLQPVPKVTRIVVGVYTLVSLLVLLYVGYIVNFARHTAELVGVPLIILALPWSLIFARFRLRLTGTPNDSLIVLSIFIAANALVLYAAGRAIEVRVRAGSKSNLHET